MSNSILRQFCDKQLILFWEILAEIANQNSQSRKTLQPNLLFL